MTTGEYVVAPEVLEKQKFDFTPHQRDQIEEAKRDHLQLKIVIIDNGSEKQLFDLQIIY